MPKRILPLTDFQVKSAKFGTKNKLSDGGGLYLLLTPTGGKLWRFNYRFGGKSRTLACGAYPEISLSVARDKLKEARQLLSEGIDPCETKQTGIKTANTFEKIAIEWLTTFKSTMTDRYTQMIEQRMRSYVFPVIGDIPIDRVTAVDVLAVMTPLAHIVNTAHRIRSEIGQVLRYAVARGKAERDITVDLRGAMPQHQGGHRAAPETPQEAKEILQAIETYAGGVTARVGVKMLPLVFVRPLELARAEWSEIDLESATWSIPATKMKMKFPHMVPLSRQAVELLNTIRPFTGHNRYVFPNKYTPTTHMSANTLTFALRQAGLGADKICAHGFRAMARTLLDEVLGVRVDYIEHQLAHAVRDTNGRAYNRCAHLDGRRQMMQQWADYLDELKK